MRTKDAITTDLTAGAEPGLAMLESATIERLRGLTAELLAADPRSAAEAYATYTATGQRCLTLPTQRLQDHLHGTTVLVTGATGVIGRPLLQELVGLGVIRRVASVSLEHPPLEPPEPTVPGVEYFYADIRDREALQRVFAKVRPDVVFHLAAEKDPSFAETAVAHTLSTNITGTRHVIEAARRYGASQLVYASTGKAMRPFSPDAYASSKKACEALLAQAAAEGDLLISGARFTHVVHRSLILRRINEWIRTDSPIRLHGAEVMFYLQSRLEAAQLLLNACLEAEEGAFWLHTIRDLELPVSLLDLALGAVAEAGKPTPIYVCGFEPGYEEFPYHSLYDPLVSGDVSPLINGFEAQQVMPSQTCPQIDRFPYAVAPSQELERCFAAAERAAAGLADACVTAAQHELSWTLVQAWANALPRATLERAGRMIERRAVRSRHPEHVGVDEALLRALK